MEHNVTVESGIINWDGTEILVICSCGTEIMSMGWKWSLDEINAAVTRHYALETDDFPGLRSVFTHIEEVQDFQPPPT